MTWQAFVTAYGWQARAADLSRILDVPAQAIVRYRQTTPSTPGSRLGFADLFARWHGRPPVETDWPAPTRIGAGYEWLGPELALLATLVGTHDVPTIAHLLTVRLRRVTGDPAAVRGRNHVQCAINRIGLQASDVTGGITIREAASRAGSLALVQQAVHLRALPTRRVGRLHVIARADFDRWLAARDRPPEGWIRLASLRAPLGIKSDSKLPEYAKLGQIPDVVFVQSSHLWFIKPETAQQIVSDAHDGRPLPWHGAPNPDNLWHAWLKWRERRHRACATCRAIWRGPAPRSFAAFIDRYVDLDLGLKRHLTHKRGAAHVVRQQPYGTCRVFRGRGVTIAEAARALRKPARWVRTQIALGVVRPIRSAIDSGAPLRITPAGLRRLQASTAAVKRGRPLGRWIGIHAAARLAGVCIGTIARWGRSRLVTRRRGPRGWQYSQQALERQARRYWATARFTRATPPAWVSTAA